MLNKTADEIWNFNDSQINKLLDSSKLKSINGSICFFAPSFTHYKTKYFCSTNEAFPAISLTGNFCALNCGHCGGKVLETMYPALTPEKLWQLGSKLKAKGAKGMLISGGCRSDGSTPLDPFASILYRLKHELDLTIFVHTGIASSKTIGTIKKADIDGVLIDVIRSSQTRRKVFNLNIPDSTYIQSLEALKYSNINVIPHVIVGLNESRFDEELLALKTIAQTIQPSALVIIAFMPIHGTQMQNTNPPKPIDIAKTICVARIMFPKTPLLLGCMRPKGTNRNLTDILATKAGVDGIAFPSEEAIQYAKKKINKIIFSSYCCAKIFSELM